MAFKAGRITNSIKVTAFFGTTNSIKVTAAAAEEDVEAPSTGAAATAQLPYRR